MVPGEFVSLQRRDNCTMQGLSDTKASNSELGINICTNIIFSSLSQTHLSFFIVTYQHKALNIESHAISIVTERGSSESDCITSSRVRWSP